MQVHTGRFTSHKRFVVTHTEWDGKLVTTAWAVERSGKHKVVRGNGGDSDGYGVMQRSVVPSAVEELADALRDDAVTSTSITSASTTTTRSTGCGLQSLNLGACELVPEVGAIALPCIALTFAQKKMANPSLPLSTSQQESYNKASHQCAAVHVWNVTIT